MPNETLKNEYASEFKEKEEIEEEEQKEDDPILKLDQSGVESPDSPEYQIDDSEEES